MRCIGDYSEAFRSLGWIAPSAGFIHIQKCEPASCYFKSVYFIRHKSLAASDVQDSIRQNRMREMIFAPFLDFEFARNGELFLVVVD
jgi:hypothetical protein